MYKHHRDTIYNIISKLKQNPDILSIIIGGSIAHGYETEISDVDIMIVLTEKAYEEKNKNNEFNYYEKESCTYEKGYIDGKYISLSYLKELAKKGNEPSRYAFEGAIIEYNKIDSLYSILKEIVRYPIEKKEENLRRFFSQLIAWHWYSKEAIKHNNKYLLQHSINQMILFSGRIILTHNEKLYPYHKWLLRVLKDTPNKPIDLIEKIDILLDEAKIENIDDLYKCINEFIEWDLGEYSWVSTFIRDTELSWLYGKPPIADI